MYPTSTTEIIVLFKRKQEIMQDLGDFALKEQPEDNSMAAISRAWHNLPSPLSQSNPWNCNIQ